MSDSPIQLEMNFNGSAGNVFRDHLNAGVFQVLVEIPSPSPETKLEHAAARFSSVEYLAAGRKNGARCALAFLDGGGKDVADPVGFASTLVQAGRDAHVIYLSGRGRTTGQLLTAIRHGASQGFKSFVPVSGSLEGVSDAGDARRTDFAESVNTLDAARTEFGSDLFFGCAANPFKYEPVPAYLQGYKLVRKLNAGASFVATQYGWDLFKLQELRWNLARRSLHVPSVSRQLFLTPERAEAIASGKVRGVTFSPDFELLLRRENCYSSAQFEAAQFRRIQIHAAGARLLGYSAIQLAGIEDARLLEILLDRIDAALREFPTFSEWYAAYREYYSRLDMAPYPHRFYLFERLFSTAAPPEDFELRDAEIPQCTGGERFCHRMTRSLFGGPDRKGSPLLYPLKKLMTSCRRCGNCRLSKTEFLCPELCPMGLINGPCGDSTADGRCPLQSRECVFFARMRQVQSMLDYQSLETGCIPQRPPKP